VRIKYKENQNHEESFSRENLLDDAQTSEVFKDHFLWFFAVVAAITGVRQSAMAATLYVNPGETPTAYPTIGAAVIRAQAGDIIYVPPGVYHEDVIIGKQLSLVGSGCGRSVIDAIGVYSNIIADNESSHNGYQVPGAGAGAGIFAPGACTSVRATETTDGPSSETKSRGQPDLLRRWQALTRGGRLVVDRLHRPQLRQPVCDRFVLVPREADQCR
jgi:hypothetical protein